MAKKTWRARRVNVPYCILAIPPRATWNNKMGTTNTTMMATINNSHKHKKKRELGVVLTWSEKWRLGKKLWGWHFSCPCFSSICNTKQHKGKHNAQPWPPWWTNKTKKVEHKNMRGKRSSTWCSHGTKRKVKKSYESWCSLCPCYFSLCNMKHMMGSIDTTMIATTKFLNDKREWELGIAFIWISKQEGKKAYEECWQW